MRKFIDILILFIYCIFFVIAVLIDEVIELFRGNEMDPYQTLRDAETAVLNHNQEDSDHFLRSYAEWRQRSGFEPLIEGKGGDEVFSHLIEMYELDFGAYLGVRP